MDCEVFLTYNRGSAVEVKSRLYTCVIVFWGRGCGWYIGCDQFLTF